jgi:hypothetical protein
MHICSLGGTGVWRGVGVSGFLTPLLAACCLAAVGCAHHRADQYSYAPPYAPPVYSQPQVQMPSQPAAPMVAAPGLPAGAMVAGTPTAGMVGSATMPATVIEGSGQTPPCPPGP